MGMAYWKLDYHIVRQFWVRLAGLWYHFHVPSGLCATSLGIATDLLRHHVSTLELGIRWYLASDFSILHISVVPSEAPGNWYLMGRLCVRL
jgi:hypothetical protein